MSPRVSLPDGVQIWAGWGHLFADFDGLVNPACQESVLVVSTLSRPQQSLIAKLHRLSPELFELPSKLQKFDINKIKLILTGVGDVAETDRRFWLKRRFLEVIQAGNATGRFAIPIPYLPAPMPNPPPSPFQLKDELRLASMRPLIRAFHQSLEDASELSPEAWWGRVVLSAMINGALLKTSFLCALPDAVIESEPEMRWFLLRPVTTAADQTPMLPRRWFPDPLTRLLCARGRRDGIPLVTVLDLSPYRQVYRLIGAYAKARAFTHLMPSGVKELMMALKTRMHHHVPPWMVDYAVDRQANVSLPDWSWDRLISPPTSYRMELTERERLITTVRGAASKDADDAEEAEEQEDWPSQLKGLASQILKRDDNLRERILHWRNAQATPLLPSVRLITDWVTDWLLAKGRGRKVKGYRSVYAMTNAIGGRLVGQLGGADLLKTDSQEAFIEVYQAALEDTVSTKARYRVANALRSFHDYLVVKHDSPKVDPEVFSVSGRIGNIVDANLIGLDTFFRALRWLSSEATRCYGKDVATELQLIAALAYFCGLRRSEAIGITTNDVKAIEAVSDVAMLETWIAIYPNGLRGVKTRAGHRDAPLHILATQVELTRFRNWFDRRKLLAAGACVPLFPSFIHNGKANDKDSKLELITRALQHCADDSTLRFHHLRHSFASWLLLMLWLGEEEDLSILPDWFLPTEHDGRRWKIAAHLRSSLLGRAPTNRRTTLQVSALMGHSGTDITFSTYIHVADFIVGRTVRRLTTDFATQTLSSLSGYSPLYIKKIQSGHSWEGRPEYRAASFIDLIADRVLRDGRHVAKAEHSVVSKVNFRTTTPVDMPIGVMARMLHVAKAINEVGVSQSVTAEVAQRFGCGEAELDAWYGRYLKLPPGMLRWSGVKDKAASTLSGIDFPVGNALELAGSAVRIFTLLGEEGAPPELGVKGAQKKLNGVVHDFEKAWVKGSYLSFESESLAQSKRWMWWIDKLGLRAGVVVSHTTSTGHGGKPGTARKSVPAPSKQREYWASGLGVDLVSDSGETIDSGTRGHVRIDIDVKDCNANVIPYQKVTVLYGVRFFCGMQLVIG